MRNVMGIVFFRRCIMVVYGLWKGKFSFEPLKDPNVCAYSKTLIESKLN